MYKPKSIRAWVVPLMVFVLSGSVCAAATADEQADRLRAMEAQLARSLELIERLTARVAELERSARPAAVAQAASAVAPAGVIEEQSKSIAALQESVNQIADGLSKNANDTGIPVHGFLDVGAGWSSGNDPVRLRGFDAGSLDIYLTPQIGSRVKSLIELVVEFDENNESSIDMERIQIGYTFSDSLTLWAGRFHTPFGLWNTSFHHGANLQTSISRPKFVDFEDRGGLIPAHSVGLWASGKVPLQLGKLTYDAYVANGPSVRDRKLDLSPFTDDNSGKMLGGNVGYLASGALNGLSVGLHGFATKVGEYQGGGTVLRNSTRVRAFGGYLGYEVDEWEAIAEYYRFRNADVDSGPTRTSNAGFVHVGRTYGSLTPFLRVERTSLDPQDNYFRSLRTGRSYTHYVVGARYALDANSSLKLELRRSRESAITQIDETGALVDLAGASYRRALFQYSIAF
jgi:hypothetical protein